tara:strand:+ start:7988 stop:8464 length:477 start_codon:yes stop_codon:yes gene_type:complete
MTKNFELRELLEDDHFVVRQVYQDSIESQGHLFYSKDQIQAWSSLAFLPGVLDRSLHEGKGWVSCQDKRIEAFAVRYPMNRLALLYCRGRSSRLGHATRLLDLVEREALHEQHIKLITEASLFSCPLLLCRGWLIQSKQTIQIADIEFDRYLMEKKLS